jgi:hypothetical protein
MPLQGQIGPIGPHGGYTETHLLPTCSLAIDQGPCFTASGTQLFVDQRGVPRLSPCDIGAYEGVPYPSVPYCTAGTTSNGCVPAISSTGTPSTTGLGNFTLTVSNVEGQRFGLIFYGITGRSAIPWGPGSTSVLCVKSPLQRTSAQPSGGTNGQCDGVLTINLDTWLGAHGGLGHPFVPGQIVDAQGWFRDPPAAKTTNLSGGLEWVVCP